MAEEFYRLRQKSTGLYLYGTRTAPPLKKDGTVSKAPRSLWGKKGRVLPHFVPDYPPQTLDVLNNDIRRVMKFSEVVLDQDDLELEVMVPVPAVDSKDKLAEMISNISQDILAEKLKGN